MTSYAHPIETSPSLGAAICETCATFVSSWEGRRSDVLRTSELDLAVPGGAAICDTVATFVGSWDFQRRGVPRRSPLDLAVPWGAAICETVATF